MCKNKPIVCSYGSRKRYGRACGYLDAMAVITNNLVDGHITELGHKHEALKKEVQNESSVFLSSGMIRQKGAVTKAPRHMVKKLESAYEDLEKSVVPFSIEIV